MKKILKKTMCYLNVEKMTNKQLADYKHLKRKTKKLAKTSERLERLDISIRDERAFNINSAKKAEFFIKLMKKSSLLPHSEQ